jgi:hypothetical protein
MANEQLQGLPGVIQGALQQGEAVDGSALNFTFNSWLGSVPESLLSAQERN